jgi:hypothetical protein
MKLLLTFIILILLVSEVSTRSRVPVRKFMNLSGYPHGRVGYVVDHIYPLCAGGSDTPENMQWQELIASKVKDIDEIRLCAVMRAFHKKWD